MSDIRVETQLFHQVIVIKKSTEGAIWEATFIATGTRLQDVLEKAPETFQVLIIKKEGAGFSEVYECEMKNGVRHYRPVYSRPTYVTYTGTSKTVQQFPKIISIARTTEGAIWEARHIATGTCMQGVLVEGLPEKFQLLVFTENTERYTEVYECETKNGVRHYRQVYSRPEYVTYK